MNSGDMIICVYCSNGNVGRVYRDEYSAEPSAFYCNNCKKDLAKDETKKLKA